MSKILQEAYDISAHFTHGEDPDVLVVHGVKFVKVINCKDCKHWREFMAGLGVCDKLKTDMDGSSYCNHGEQSEQSEEVKDNERK